MHLGRAIAPETFRVEAPTDAAEGDAVCVRVIEVLPGSVPDREVRAALTVTDGALESDLDQDVLKTFVYTPDEVVQQEIALYKVTRSRGVEQLVREHNVRILEIDEDYIVVEKTGHKADTQALFRLLQPYGVQQFVRSGTVAIIKSRRELLNEYLEELARNDRKLS